MCSVSEEAELDMLAGWAAKTREEEEAAEAIPLQRKQYLLLQVENIPLQLAQVEVLRLQTRKEIT